MYCLRKSQWIHLKILPLIQLKNLLTTVSTVSSIYVLGIFLLITSKFYNMIPIVIIYIC